MSPDNQSGLQANGLSPEEVFIAAERQHDALAGIRAVRSVFGLSLEEAKEVMIRVRGHEQSLAEYQGQLLPELEQALREEESG